MADFCNQCARELGFPEGDLASSERTPPPPGVGYPELCEGCGECLVDEKGNCVDPCCIHSHGCLAKAAQIMEEYKKRLDKVKNELTGLGFMLLLEEVAREICVEPYQFKIVQQIHDEYVVEVSFKQPSVSLDGSPVDLIDAAYSALSSLADIEEGDEDVMKMLQDIEKGLQYALDLKQTIIDMDKWVGENEGIGCCGYVDYDKDVNTTKSYLIAKELTDVNRI